MNTEAELSQPPNYEQVMFDENLPPDYTPSLHHLSLVYYANESNYVNDKTLDFVPLLFEINSTQINLYRIKEEYARLVAHCFNDLHPNFVDSNLNVKSKNSSKLNFVGQGIGSSTALFNLADINHVDNDINDNSLPAQPRPLLTNPSSSSSSLATMFSSNSTNSILSNPMSLSSSGSSFSPSLTRGFNKNSISKLFDKLSIKRQNPTREMNYTGVVLDENEKKSQDLIYTQKLLNNQPDINMIVDVDYTPQEAQLLNFRSNLFASFSLQELVKFGNASDFQPKPFTLRLIFPTNQFLLVSYNAQTFASIFYKLNIAKEISLDLDLRVVYPLDYCVPRRSRRSRNARRNTRNRSSTTGSINSASSTGGAMSNARAVSRMPNRSRSNSLLNDDPDDDDEFDTTFNIDSEQRLNYQPQPSVQPQIILEDRILDDIIQLEPAQQVMSTLSTVSRTTTTSVFSSVERYATQVTDITMSSLSPISSETEEVLDSSSIHDVPQLEKLPPDEYPQSKYKELVFAIKCIRSCKNKTLPWIG